MKGRRPAASAKTTPPSTETPAKRLAGFIAKFDPAVARTARDALRRMRKRLPGAFELVYDNYNALAIAFSPTEKRSDIICSIVLYPRWVSLFFMHGAALADPHGVLKGSGKTVRHVVLSTAAVLDEPAVSDLLERAIEASPPPVKPSGRGRPLIKMALTNQRPRRRGSYLSRERTDRAPSDR